MSLLSEVFCNRRQDDLLEARFQFRLEGQDRFVPDGERIPDLRETLNRLGLPLNLLLQFLSCDCLA